MFSIIAAIMQGAANGIIIGVFLGKVSIMFFDYLKQRKES